MTRALLFLATSLAVAFVFSAAIWVVARVKARRMKRDELSEFWRKYGADVVQFEKKKRRRSSG